MKNCTGEGENCVGENPNQHKICSVDDVHILKNQAFNYVRILNITHSERLGLLDGAPCSPS